MRNPPPVVCRKHGEQTAVVQDVYIVGEGPAPWKDAYCPKCLADPLEFVSDEIKSRYANKKVKPGMYSEIRLS